MIAHIQIRKDETQREQSVLEHLKGTAEIAKRLGSKSDMGCLAYLAGILHDLGKWRKRFEDYLRAAVSGEGHVRRGEVNHSSAGAVYVCQRYYKGGAIEKLTAQLIAVAILSHHGLNDCMTPEGVNHFRDRVENLDGLDYEEVMRNFRQSPISEDGLDKCFAGAVKEVQILLNMFSDYKLSIHFTIAMLERMLLSILIDSDRLNTAVFCGDRATEDIEDLSVVPWDELRRNLDIKLDSLKKQDEISRLRRKIADECLEFARRPDGIYRLAVPTGGAKTLSSMRFALNHVKIHGKKRIFYIGPYLSILEQNSQVFREALGHEELILEHHSNIVFQDDDQEGRTEQNRYKLLTENWDSSIVITTFVQFLNTLFDGSTQSVRRFHNLADSVIIVDEIQSLPIQMIHIFNMAINYLHDICHATVVLCSATQPVLDKVRVPIHMSQPADMIADVDELYRRLKRVRIEEKKGNMDTAQLREFIADIMREQDNALVILNTKTAARLLYRELFAYYRDAGENVLLIHLSTSMCAEHRLHFISKIKEKLGSARIVCVSTSLIEAGVDLSFSCVVRSFAGLDSIAQAAGRCNRNGEQDEGTVYLIHYGEERLGRLEQILKGAKCSETIVDIYQEKPERYEGDLLSRAALNDFYERYYCEPEQVRKMDYPLENRRSNILDLLCENRAGKNAFVQLNGRQKNPELVMFQAFKTAGQIFAVIDQDTTGVIVPFGEGKEIIEKLNGELDGRAVPALLRKAQRFTVNLYRSQLNTLGERGALFKLKNGGAVALTEGFYDDKVGINEDGILEFMNV